MDIYGILAHPAGHSLSPAMHNAGFKALNLNAKYQRFDIPPEDLEQFIQKVRKENIKGLNVSTPHKENVMALLDVIDDIANTIGAVNTIVNKNGELHGTNVDWLGQLSISGAKNYRGWHTRGKIVGVRWNELLKIIFW